MSNKEKLDRLAKEGKLSSTGYFMGLMQDSLGMHPNSLGALERWPVKGPKRKLKDKHR